MKRTLLTLAATLLSAGLLVGCGGNKDNTAVTIREGVAENDGDTAKIGILLPVEHVALNNAKDGFVAAMKENGFSKATFKVMNAAGNEVDLSMFAKSLVDECDLFLGVGTGASQVLLSAETNASLRKPLLFTAVTDPVDAGLVDSKENKSGFVCGTTDANPVEAQIDLVKEFNSSFTKIGLLYTQEPNSVVQARQAEKVAKAKGFSVTHQIVQTSADIKAQAEALAQKVDAIYVPTDNTLAANMNAVQTAADNNHTLIVTGEEGMLATGGHITLSIDYVNLGHAAGEMASSILKQEKKPVDFKVEAVPASNCAFVMSTPNLTASGLEMSETMKNAHNWVEYAA